MQSRKLQKIDLQSFMSFKIDADLAFYQVSMSQLFMSF